MFICCLGLFGLAHISTQQRQKEIGIRKVLGASVREIVGLLSGSFMKPVVVAFLVAAPCAWLVMNKWLENFNFRISIGVRIFLVAAALAIVMVMIAVTSQSIKAAIANPVDAMRNDL